MSALVRGNREAWNASAALHRAGAEWRRLAEGFASPGFSTLDATLAAHLRALPVAGRSVVQVGCNNGRELLSLRTLGAGSLLGIDQSDAFLAQAAELSTIADGDASFLLADIYALPADVPDDFGLALVTIGVLNWMPDLPGFFRAVAGLLAPGGALNATIGAGLVLESFTEYPHSNREVDYAVYEGRAAQLPMCYLLQARKPD